MSEFKDILFGMGNPLLDITAEVDVKYLEKNALKQGSAIMAEPKHVPIYAELVKDYKVSYTGGGATQNVFRSFQWMLQGGEGCSNFAGCIGDDDFGKQMKKCIEEDGVKPFYMIDPDNTPTGTCACMIDKTGERTLIANLSAAEKYKRDHFDTPVIQDLIKKAKMYYFSGFFITVAPDCMLDVAKASLADEEKKFAINLSAEFVINFFWEKMEPIVNIADYLFGNEVEAACLSKKLGLGTDNPEEIAVKFAEKLPYDDKNPKTVVITQGIKPTLVAEQVGEGKASLKQFDVKKVEVVDTTGAGDSFVGGFLSQLAKGKGVEICVRAGQFSSGQIVQTSGVVFPSTPPEF